MEDLLRFVCHVDLRVIRISFSFAKICKVSTPGKDEEFDSSRSVGLPLLGSLHGSIIDLISNRGTESIEFYWIPPTLGRQDDFHPQFYKTSRLRSLDNFRT